MPGPLALKSVRRCRGKAGFQNGPFNRLGLKLAGKKDKVKARLTPGIFQLPENKGLPTENRGNSYRRIFIPTDTNTRVGAIGK